MSPGSRFLNLSIVPPSHTFTGPPNSNTNAQNPTRGFTHSVFGIAGYVKNKEEFDRTQVARQGNTVLLTDYFDEHGDNEVTIFPSLTGVPSLIHPSLFVPKESVLVKLRGFTKVITYKRPAPNVAWIKVIDDDKDPVADEDFVRSLVPPIIASACTEWWPVEVQMCLEGSPDGSLVQETTVSQDSRVFEGRFC
jgi:hypothetical protein